jgi:acyl carrier protein
LAHLPQPPSSFFSEFVAAAAVVDTVAAPATFVQQLEAIPAATAAASTPAAASQAGQPALDAAATEQQVSEVVDDAVSSILGVALDPEEPLMAAGLDSLGAVELRNMLQESLAVQLPNTVRPYVCVTYYVLLPGCQWSTEDAGCLTVSH